MPDLYIIQYLDESFAETNKCRLGYLFWVERLSFGERLLIAPNCHDIHQQIIKYYGMVRPNNYSLYSENVYSDADK